MLADDFSFARATLRTLQPKAWTTSRFSLCEKTIAPFVVRALARRAHRAAHEQENSDFLAESAKMSCFLFFWSFLCSIPQAASKQPGGSLSSMTSVRKGRSCPCFQGTNTQGRFPRPALKPAKPLNKAYVSPFMQGFNVERDASAWSAGSVLLLRILFEALFAPQSSFLFYSFS
ncbi:MAG: hypothetical protein EOM20_07635 [Spartobacteria bacterium]|nr:hypothetical protein [Spartobacteria bacterium]